MKYAKQWLLVGVVGLGVASVWVGAGRGEGGGGEKPTVEPTPSPVEAPSPTATPDELSVLGGQIQQIMLDYDTQAINTLLIESQLKAQQEGKQQLDVIKELQRRWANDYAFEVKNGQGRASTELRRSLMRQIAHSLIAESVLRKGQPMQMVSINEKAIVCLIQPHTGIDVGGDCNGRSR